MSTWGLPDRAVVTPDEIATAIGVSSTVVRRAIADQRLPAFRIGRLLRVKRGDAERWLEEGSTLSANTGSDDIGDAGSSSGTMDQHDGVTRLRPRPKAKPDKLLSAMLAGKT